MTTEFDQTTDKLAALARQVNPAATPEYREAWAAGWMHAADAAVQLVDEVRREARREGRREMADYAAEAIAVSPAAIVAASLAAPRKYTRIVREGGQIVAVEDAE